MTSPGKRYEQNINIHQLYTDFRQSCGCIYEALAEFGIPSKLISLTTITLETTYNKVKIQDNLSDSFMTNAGVRQGGSGSLSIVPF
jgi:hypothetical protein